MIISPTRTNSSTPSFFKKCKLKISAAANKVSSVSLRAIRELGKILILPFKLAVMPFKAAYSFCKKSPSTAKSPNSVAKSIHLNENCIKSIKTPPQSSKTLQANTPPITAPKSYTVTPTKPKASSSEVNLPKPVSISGLLREGVKSIRSSFASPYSQEALPSNESPKTDPHELEKFKNKHQSKLKSVIEGINGKPALRATNTQKDIKSVIQDTNEQKVHNALLKKFESIEPKTPPNQKSSPGSKSEWTE